MARCGLRGPSPITSRTPTSAPRLAQRRLCTNIGPVFRPRSTTALSSFHPESRAMNPSRGFTLAELAVAVAIIGLLLAGALIPFSTQIDVRNTADTQRAMESVREAIIGFAQANGRLPCPADGSIAAGLANAGTEQLIGTSCTAFFGVVPWATLGAPETDAWGRRFSYRVSRFLPTFPLRRGPPPRHQARPTRVCRALQRRCRRLPRRLLCVRSATSRFSRAARPRRPSLWARPCPR